MAEGRRPDTKMMARRVIDLLEADLAAGGFDLLDIRIFQGGGRYQVRIFVDLLERGEDAADGVSMGQVTKAARTANMLLEEADLFAGEYVVEVSSPGIRRPLRKLEHYQSAIGKRIDLKVAGASRVRGVLQEMDGDVLVVELPAAEAAEATAQTPQDETEETAAPSAVRIELNRVIEANQDPEFDAQALINADRRRRKEAKRLSREEKAGRKKKGRPKNRPKDRPE